MNKEKIEQAIKTIVGHMNLECEVEFKEEESKNGKALLVLINSQDSGRFLIGKNGQTLEALEHIIRALFLKGEERGVTLAVDINDYKRTKASYVIELAKQAVMRVRSTQKAEALLPMTAYERRMVHMELASYPDVATESIGEDPQRRIVIKPYA
jgi:spoIIIJ-associated protein